MNKTTPLLFCLFLMSCASSPTQYVNSIQGAIEAEQNGNHQQALTIYQNFAEKGDSKAMISVGSKYYNGEGVKRDYQLTMDWWLKAFEANNGDALNNIGVLYRDGKGVKQNRKIAYTLFLATHMEGLGDGATQGRANNNLRREVAELSDVEIKEALCYTWPYILKYVRSRGALTEISEDLLPSAKIKNLKNLGWWTKHEREGMSFECPDPWKPIEQKIT